MTYRGRCAIFVLIIPLILISLISAPVLAHAPLAVGNHENLGSATTIPDPTKSWALYAELSEGEDVHYYRFDIREGERISVSLFTTTAPEDERFDPVLILMGPGITERDTVPPFIETVSNSGILVVRSSRAAVATFEGFSPSAFVDLARISRVAPANGTYYLVVYGESGGGHYGLAIGNRESFTLTEWMVMPFSLLSIYAWERQNLLVILAPAFAVVILGALLLRGRRKDSFPLDTAGRISVAAGLLFLGTGATVFSQLVYALSRSSPDPFIVVTIVLGIVPLMLGLVTLRLALHHSGRWTSRSRAGLLIIAVLATVSWSGYLIGPVLALIAGIVPSFHLGLPDRKF
jgi:hypothetical protein